MVKFRTKKKKKKTETARAPCPKKKPGQVATRQMTSSCLRPGGLVRGSEEGEVSAGVGLKECNDDVEVLSCGQNGLTQIRFD